MTSKIKVDNINKVSDDSNIINKCGTTITLGASGDSIALASGASQTGFGRTGTVDWQTGSIKTSTFTAANGEGYFVNTTGGAVTANLPAGSAGAIVSFSDYTRTFGTNALTINPNGSEKIGGFAGDAILNVDGQAITLVYVDATEGWINIQNAEDTETGTTGFIMATGGTITQSGNCRIHTFTGPGTFCVSNIANTPACNQISYMVVAGGGGGGGGEGTGGGGAGGFREDKSPTTSYTASPLDGASDITVTSNTSFPITIGGGGAAGTPGPAPSGATKGIQGSTSTFSTISSAGGGGGGGGGGQPVANGTGGNGGSGGGGGGRGNCGAKPGGSGNTPSVSPPQGNGGGASTSSTAAPNVDSGGGGGGATGTGADSTGAGSPGGAGGTGATTEISGSSTGYAGGGGGGSELGVPGPGTQGGGSNGNAGTVNTGGGGSGTTPPSGVNGGAGGSGIVIIRYKFQ